MGTCTKGVLANWFKKYLAKMKVKPSFNCQNQEMHVQSMCNVQVIAGGKGLARLAALLRGEVRSTGLTF